MNSGSCSQISSSCNCPIETANRFIDSHSSLETASFPVVLGDFGFEVTCQACRESSPRTRFPTRFQASSGNSDSANWPGSEAALENHTLFQAKLGKVYIRFQTKTAQNSYPFR